MKHLLLILTVFSLCARAMRSLMDFRLPCPPATSTHHLPLTHFFSRPSALPACAQRPPERGAPRLPPHERLLLRLLPHAGQRACRRAGVPAGVQSARHPLRHFPSIHFMDFVCDACLAPFLACLLAIRLVAPLCGPHTQLALERAQPSAHEHCCLIPLLHSRSHHNCITCSACLFVSWPCSHSGACFPAWLPACLPAFQMPLKRFAFLLVVAYLLLFFLFSVPFYLLVSGKYIGLCVSLPCLHCPSIDAENHRLIVHSSRI